MPSCRFLPCFRLHLTQQIQTLQRSKLGERFVAFETKRVKNVLGYARIGWIVPKYWNLRANKRNLARRLIREAFRLNCTKIGAWDLLIKVKVPMTLANQIKIREELDQLFKNLPC